MTPDRQFEPAPPLSPGDLSDLLGDDPSTLNLLFDGIPARVVVLDCREYVIFVNREFYRFTRLSAQQVLGAHISQIIGREGYEVYKPAREQILDGQAMHWEGWVNLPNHGMRFTRESLIPHGPKGEPPHAIVAMSLDITEQKLRENELAEKVAALEASESLKSSIVDNALAALVSADAHGIIVEFNPAAERMFGRARALALGLPVGDVIIPERFRSAHSAGMARLRDAAPARILGQRMELVALHADGREFPVEMVLWRTGVGATMHYTASINDLSERREAAQQLQRERERLRQSEKLSAMGSLLAGVAHELNNPLAIVVGRADLLVDKCADRPDIHDDARRIQEAADRCARIVRTFLNMARARPAAHAPTSLNDLARAATDMLGYSYRTHGIECQLALNERLPLVEADPDQIGQIVLNLMVNAQQTLSEFVGLRHVTLKTGYDATSVWLHICDSGPGVSVDLRERIFEPFFTTKAEGVGTGLGLAVSRSMAREHGGDLVLESDAVASCEAALDEIARGAKFRLRLPLRVAPEPAIAPDTTNSTDNAKRQVRVLVVDDEPGLTDLMRSIIEAAGHDVACAESGAVALEMLDVARFDVIITDLRMPDMDGAALWAAVRDRCPYLAQRMVFVTGDTLSPSAGRFLNENRALVLDKPFTAQDLRHRLDEVLARPHGPQKSTRCSRS